MIHLKKLLLIIPYAIVCGLGILSHYAYDFFRMDALKAIFPSNESIFEHLKLFIFPSFLYMIFDILISKNKERIFSSYVSGNIVASVFLISAYYTYSGIIGKSISLVNILIFFICVFIIFFYRYKRITLFDGANSVIAFIIFILIIEIFSFYPTNINLFIDPTEHEVHLEAILNLLP